MKRLIKSSLEEWKGDKLRKVLLVRGARQVGKTYSIRSLGEGFPSFLEVNFEANPRLRQFFQGSLQPKELCPKLSDFFGTPIIPGKTLLFFDEIQAAPEALRSLRFFQEEMPGLHVVAAGSLLEFTLEEIPSFGVGRLTSLFMYPMTFQEFLWARGEEGLLHQLQQAGPQHPLDEPFHLRLLSEFRNFQIVGGMPEAVAAYCAEQDLRACQKILDGLLVTFRDDFAKYKERAPVLRLQEVFTSITQQAGSKFKYAHVSDQGYTQGTKEALELLIKAGLAYRVFHTAGQGLPLGGQMNPKKFKVIPFDTGLHQRTLGLDLSEHLLLDDVQFINKGNLAEVSVGLELIGYGPSHLHPQLFYWHREARSSNAEVDYLIQRHDQIIPLEIKAGSKGAMRSLNLFLQERNLPLGIRISQENFSNYGKIQTVPLYAIRQLWA